jgi:hypothetical protein
MGRLVAEMENSNGKSDPNKCLTIVVLPVPEGAEKIISLHSIHMCFFNKTIFLELQKYKKIGIDNE